MGKMLDKPQLLRRNDLPIPSTSWLIAADTFGPASSFEQNIERMGRGPPTRREVGDLLSDGALFIISLCRPKRRAYLAAVARFR